MIESYSPKFEAGLLGVNVGFGGTKSTETTTQRLGPTPDTVTLFTSVVSILAKQQPARDGILFIVDEFDQIKDKTGFASFLKSLATNVPAARFAIVGVAHDLYDLMKEHESSDRLFAGGVIPVPSMSPDELAEAIDIAESR